MVAVISILSLFSFITIFSYSFNLFRVDELIYSTPKTYAYLSIYEENNKLYFNSGKIEQYYDAYYSPIEQYTTAYDIKYHYYDPYSGGLLNKDILAVEIKIKATLAYIYEYEKAFYFELLDNEVIQK